MPDQVRTPVLSIPHGGGPCFFMDFPPPFPPHMWDDMANYLRSSGAAVSPRPKAILVISAHWATRRPTIHFASAYSLYFDYYGFPPHTYELRYPAKGAPQVAARVRDLLAGAGIASDEEHERGLDHGVFIPFLLMFPEADIPIVQLSLRTDMDPSAHLAIGQALEPLRDEGVLIIGTGMTYHNLGNFRQPGVADNASREFDSWLTDAVTDPVAARRNEKLAAWRKAPNAQICHPTPEHLLPLHIAAGAAGGDVGRRVFHGDLMGKVVSGYQFG